MSAVIAREMIGRVRLGLAGAGANGAVTVHYGGKGRDVHRLWLTADVLGVERRVCMMIDDRRAHDAGCLGRFVAQALEQGALMALANKFRP